MYTVQVHNTQVYSFIRNSDNKIDNKYFLAILNSKIAWFYLKSSGNVLRGGYLRFKSKYLEPFCIPIPEEKKKTLLISNITNVLDKHKKFDETYNKFVNLIRINFKAEKIPTSLTKFYQYTFHSLITSLQNETKTKLSLKDQSDFMDFFESTTKDLIRLKTDIDKLDDEINKIVYDLYNLDKNEIEIVEKNYPKIN